MKLCFELSMPNVGSWNGRWTGEGKCYARIIDFGKSKIGAEKASAILANDSYGYNFVDGWCARISVKEVTSKEATSIKRRSAGFCGYEWMIDSIRKHGDIRID